MPLQDARKVDLGYARTSHSSQGATVDRVITNIDTTRSPDLINQRQSYISLSRARLEARIYTDDAQHLRHAASRTREKDLALDLLRERQQRRMTMRI
jgi:ATP-dependent exoDNAse (exonuclease V) alpha subunit